MHAECTSPSRQHDVDQTKVADRYVVKGLLQIMNCGKPMTCPRSVGGTATSVWVLRGTSAAAQTVQHANDDAPPSARISSFFFSSSRRQQQGERQRRAVQCVLGKIPTTYSISKATISFVHTPPYRPSPLCLGENRAGKTIPGGCVCFLLAVCTVLLGNMSTGFVRVNVDGKAFR